MMETGRERSVLSPYVRTIESKLKVKPANSTGSKEMGREGEAELPIGNFSQYEIVKQTSNKIQELGDIVLFNTILPE